MFHRPQNRNHPMDSGESELGETIAVYVSATDILGNSRYADPTPARRGVRSATRLRLRSRSRNIFHLDSMSILFKRTIPKENRSPTPSSMALPAQTISDDGIVRCSVPSGRKPHAHGDSNQYRVMDPQRRANVTSYSPSLRGTTSLLRSFRHPARLLLSANCLSTKWTLLDPEFPRIRMELQSRRVTHELLVSTTQPP